MSEIVGSGNHYVCQLKKNTPGLLQAVQARREGQPPLDRFECRQKARGRQTAWRTEVYSFDQPQACGEWMNLRTFIVIHKTLVRKDKDGRPVETRSVSYRVSDVEGLSAESFFKGIRGHWGIENRLHWVRDVILNEDRNGIRHMDGAANMAVFNTLAINFLRRNVDDSITNAQTIFGQNIKERLPFLRN